MLIILDTNFLVYCTKNKIDYPEEIGNLLKEGHELVVPFQVIDELKNITQKEKVKKPLRNRSSRYKKTTGADKLAAELALKLLEANNVKRVEAHGKNVDEAIINLANEDKKNIVATLDLEMRQKLGRVILINRFKRLMLTR